MASRRISLVANDRLVEFARGRRGVRAGGEEERGVRGGIGKRDGHAAGAGPGHLGAKHQQRGVGGELGAQFIALSPLANGLLTDTVGANASFGDGDYRAVMPQFRDYGANAELLALVRRLAAVHDATPAQLSLAWVMAKGAVPIPGSRKPERLRENLAATDFVLTADGVADIDATAMSEVFGGTKS